ncbi:MAG: UPF0182 family protein [Fimbriimonadaceae bacterium]|jgi:hypothetical protein|nr:UPF0182 family protein [Fimbriimonadaceae bacterium]
MRKVRLRTVEGEEQQSGKGFLVWAVVLALVVAVFSLFGKYTEWQWFLHDARQPEVFLKGIGTEAGLWVFGFVLAAIPLYLTTQYCLKMKVKLPPRDLNTMAAASDILWVGIQKAAKPVSIVLAILFGILTGNSLTGRVESFWMFRYGGDFGVKDPVFNLDLGFYAFKLPFLQTILGSFTGVVALCAGVMAILYFLAGSAVNVGGGEFDRKHLHSHVCTLGGVILILVGASMILGRYSSLTEVGETFPGPGFAQNQALDFMLVAGVLGIVVGLLTLVNPFWRKDFKIPIVGASVWAALSFIVLGLVPGLINSLYVTPNRLTVERPFVERAIQMTRYAYGLDIPGGRAIEVNNFVVQPSPTAQELAASKQTLDNMRLWDPEVLLGVLDGLQGLRPYYTFPDVDIDRYMINGEQRMVMLSARNINADGLSPGSKNWQTTHLKYTHGFGLVMSKVNEAGASGRPQFIIENVPPVSRMGQEVTQPRVYFSDYRRSIQEREGYVLLRTNTKEFDYPAQSEQEYVWTGTRGIPVGPILNKIAMSLRFGDGNLFVSRDLNSETRLIFRRDFTDRAEQIYPMLRFDQDPYMVLHEGRIFWILDGYTTSRHIPYSQTLITAQGRLNYIRNSAKVIMDAYTGDMTAYVMDEKEPVIAMIRRAFPGLIKPLSEMPEGLRPHLRYGEDFFLQQAQILTTYHVTDATVFLNNEDAWQIPTEIGRGNNAEPIKPYYVQIGLPGENRQGFMLIMPFSPVGKENMIGWMAAMNDGQDYGRLLLYKFPKDSQTPGPSQMEATFNADREVAEVNRLLNNNQSRIVPGNLLVIPIGSSILYVKPLFLQSTTAGIRPIPELKKVILGLPNNRVVMGDSYQEALELLFGKGRAPVEAQAPPTGATTEPSQPSQASQAPTLSAEALEQVRRIGKLLDDADAALRQGDFARYGQLQQQARDAIKQLSP